MTRNPALADPRLLIGLWRTELFHGAFLPDSGARIAGALSVEWIE